MLFYDAEDGEIVGSADELKALASAVYAQSKVYAKTCAGAEIELLDFRLAPGKVILSCKPDRLVLTGPVEKLQVVADNIRLLSEEAPSASCLQPHIHMEAYPGHPLFDATSDPLIVTLSAGD